MFRLEVVYSVCHLQYANVVFLTNKSSFCSYATIARVGVHNLPFRLKRISCSSCGLILPPIALAKHRKTMRGCVSSDYDSQGVDPFKHINYVYFMCACL